LIAATCASSAAPAPASSGAPSHANGARWDAALMPAGLIWYADRGSQPCSQYSVGPRDRWPRPFQTIETVRAS